MSLTLMAKTTNNYVVMPQNGYATFPCEPYGVSRGGITLGGGAFLAQSGISLFDYLGATYQNILDNLDHYLRIKTDVLPTTTDIINLNLEHPISPQEYGEYLTENGYRAFKAYIRSTILRINAVRERLPNCKIALYGHPIPSGNGLDNRKWRSTMKGLLACIPLGLYEKVDYLNCILYVRDADASQDYNDLLDKVNLVFSRAREITKANGSPIPLILSTTDRVLGHNHVVPTLVALSQINRIQTLSREGDIIGIWMGDPSSIYFEQWLSNTFPLPKTE